MRLKSEFVSAPIANDTALIATGGSEFRGIVRGNETFADIISLLREDTTEDAVVAAMHDIYDAEEGAIERSVAHVIAELRRIGALEE